VASELAARMNAMANASDNAKELKKNLSLSYNRQAPGEDYRRAHRAGGGRLGVSVRS